ncbi:hypothetical protein SDC9_143960 [bioreactor metagenome]|uniref:Uncharacterized protein n=1 Tax=bioreactor metagenome TaxID=1076179 RepID=A0A645E5L3_9ZZZZ
MNKKVILLFIIKKITYFSNEGVYLLVIWRGMNYFAIYVIYNINIVRVSEAALILFSIKSFI